MPNNDTIYKLAELLALANVSSVSDVTEIKAKTLKNGVESVFSYVPKAPAPTISLSGDIISWSAVQGATSYSIYVDNVLKDSTSSLSFDLSNLSYTSTDNHEVKITANIPEFLGNYSNSVYYYHEANAVPAYLLFSSPSSFTLNVIDNQKYWDGTLEYSTDANTWNTWSGTTTLSSGVSGNNNVLYLRGTGNTKITGSSASSTKAYWILTGSNISCIGNIENLLDYATVALGNHPVMASHCYSYIFYERSSLAAGLITAPSLPATTLANNCYNNMFYNCRSLTSAPQLPATTLANNCYGSMFYGCSSLTTAPALPATTLAQGCYVSMFQNCTSLTQAPELPATTLAQGCYSSMFEGCRALTTAPQILATTLAGPLFIVGCCMAMFRNCTSLTTAPALPATTLAEYCYMDMFYGCTSLTSIPELPATTLAQGCYSSMFYGCSNIKLSATQEGDYQTPYRIPTSGTGTTATGAFSNMLYNTGGTFTGNPTIDTTYYTSNTIIPAS